jgi:multidrug transporter EmrE-like cation transporter
MDNMEKYFFLLIIAIISGSIGQILLKIGANQSLPLIPGMGSVKDILLSVFVFLKNYKILLALVLYGMGFFLWIFVLTKFQLSYAYPIMAGTYIVVMILSWLFLGENITVLKLVGTLLVTLGVIFIVKGV